MAQVRNHRDLYDELAEGATDNVMKKRREQWSNVVDDETENGLDLLFGGVNAYGRTPSGSYDRSRYLRGVVRGR